MNAHSDRRQSRVVVFDVLASTNTSILEAGEADAPEGTTHLARHQTHGRGRGDHTWWSPAGGGLWMSTLLRPCLERRLWGGLTLVAATAVYDTLKEDGLGDLALYWPNDLQVGPKKLGGVLGEIRSRGDRAWVALGIGVNIHLAPAAAAAGAPEELAGKITSLCDEGAPVTTDPLELALMILERFWPLYDRFQDGLAVRDIVGGRLAHVGKPVEVRAPQRATVRGTLHGLGASGELLVKVPTSDRERGTPECQAGGGGPWPPPRADESHGTTACGASLLTIVSGDVSYEDGP